MYEKFAYRTIRKIDYQVKKASFFPVKTGFMRDCATYCYQMPSLFNSSTACLKFDSAIAPYIPFLEEGTKEHNIPNAFGNGPFFGIGGRFNGKFHPGSKNHVGFISINAYQLAKGIALDEASKRFTIIRAEEI